LVVQALLEIIYNNSTTHKKRRKQVFGGKDRPVVKSILLLPDTPKLLTDFQRNDLKRVKQLGFCNRAPLTKSDQFKFNTLVNLWGLADVISVGLSKEDILSRLRREHPSLQNLPILFGDQD
jgi:hypothetical protein